MEILKGMVREKGFEDKECTYMKTDDGKQFYFIENFQLSNGNIMACSDLSQGVGNKPRETIGVITPRGDIVIPFENKMIKPLDNNLLLVERNTPATQNVVDALAKKDDPQAATTFMNDANTIKGQLKSVMAGGENFIFDNPFSEAALYTVEGVNVGGNYFSFIGQNGNDFYLSTNIVGSSILKYDSSVNMNGGSPNNGMPTASQNENIPGNANTNVETQSAGQQGVNVPVDSQLGNESGAGALNQEPLVPNIEIPLQLQQQVEGVMPSEEAIASASAQSTEANQSIQSASSDSQSQPESQEVNQANNSNDASVGEIPKEGDVPKTELNIELPLSDALEENSQDATTNSTSESSNDIATSTDTATSDGNQSDNMVNIDGDSPSTNIPSVDSANTNTENNDTGITDGDTQVSSTNQVTEETSEENSPVSEETESEASGDLNIPEVNEEDEEDTESEEENALPEEGDLSSENVAEEEEEEDSGEDTSNEGGTDIESELPEDFDENEEEGESEGDTSVDGGVDIESESPEDSDENEEEEEFSKDNLENEEESEEDNYEEYQEEEVTNPVIIDATNTIRKLLEENRRQREIIDRQDSEIETLASSNSILKENNDSKSKEIISLRNSMAKYRSQNTSLTRENNNLKATNLRQEELIDNLKSQNITLKEQVAGISALGNAVKEATTVIETHQEEFPQPSELSYLDTAMGEIAYQKKKTI